MYLIIGSILFLFFGIGSLVTQYINKQSKEQQANERWLKLVLYFVILIMVFSCIYFELTVSLAICIGIIGLFEISKAHIFSNKRIIFFFFSVFIYLTILFAFIKFSDNTLTENVCFVYFTVITFDGFSQLTGQLFGKRKLLPQISPNKTFEGLLGGLILTTSSSFFFFQYIDFSIGQTIATAISICFTALTGDLLASLLKRKYQIKDYSKLIPGHGGILDRFDSFIFSGAMYWLADLFQRNIIMKNDLLNLLLLALTFLLLFALSEFLYHQYKIKVELTRKLVHIGTGLICLLFPILLKNHWSVLFLCGLFAVILLLSLKFNLLKSINAVDRKSVGSIVYPVAVYLCFLIQTSLDECYIYYYLPLVTLAICDPMAALSGKKWPLAQYKIFGAKKTLMGSTVFFICAMIVMFLTWRSVYNSNLDSEEFIVIATIALTATLAEAFSKDGYDNLTIPVSILVCLYIYFP